MKQITVTEKMQSTASTLMHIILAKVRSFQILDFAIRETGLICLGAWLASVFAKPAKKLKAVFLVSFLLSWAYLIWRIFFQDDYRK